MARHISISDYSYQLPEEKIAAFPLTERDSSKLLVYENGEIADSQFYDLNKNLPDKSLLVFNQTKVVCARILFPLDGKVKNVEIFILEPSDNLPVDQAMLQRGSAKWICLVGNNRYFKNETLVRKFYLQGKEYSLSVKKPVKTKDAFEVEFEWSHDLTFSDILNIAGLTPLPPYLKRELQENDKTRYQTVYAKQEGSVAAPTAGLHFTDKLLTELQEKGHSITELTLHVGAGTFRPVKAEKMESHVMHNEEIIVSKNTLQLLKENMGQIIAVGTTSLRTLESLFWLGLKLKINPKLEELIIEQWEPYDLNVSPAFEYKHALEELIDYLNRTQQSSIKAKTGLLIAPGYNIRSAKGLVTNFHQPNSTLLLLVAAFIGDNWRKVYSHALNNNYRFLSFGDSSLLLR